MRTATISGRIDQEIDALLAKQATGMKRSQLVSRDVTEKVLERAYPGIGFRDGAAGREAYLLGHRVAVWEVGLGAMKPRVLRQRLPPKAAIFY